MHSWTHQWHVWVKYCVVLIFYTIFVLLCKPLYSKKADAFNQGVLSWNKVRSVTAEDLVSLSLCVTE